MGCRVAPPSGDQLLYLNSEVLQDVSQFYFNLRETYVDFSYLKNVISLSITTRKINRIKLLQEMLRDFPHQDKLFMNNR
jgi:hypothetical protein